MTTLSVGISAFTSCIRNLQIAAGRQTLPALRILPLPKRLVNEINGEGGVESSQNLASLRDPAISFEFLQIPFSATRTVAHTNEPSVSRPVPLGEGAGGGVARGSRADLTDRLALFATVETRLTPWLRPIKSRRDPVSWPIRSKQFSL